MFIESQYPFMIAEGLLIPQQPYLRDDHLKEPETWKGPRCTRSQMIRYIDRSGQWAVEVHQYLRQNGTLGASGKADPKRLRMGKTVFIAETLK